MAHRAHAARVGGDQAADGRAVARGEVDAGVEAGGARVGLQGGERDARARPRPARPPGRPARGRSGGSGLSTTSPPRGTPAPTSPCCRPAARPPRRARAQAREHGDDLRGVAGAHDGAAPGPGSAASSRSRRARARRRRRARGRRRRRRASAARGGRSRRGTLPRLAGMSRRRPRDTRPSSPSRPRRSSSAPARPPTPAGSSSAWASRARCSSPIRASPRRPPRARARAIEAEGIEVVVYDRARVEPTIESFQDAADAARDAGVDGFVSVGGGSSIDTAKVADLITTHPAPVMDYVNPPVGEGRKPPSPAAAAPGDPDHLGHRAPRRRRSRCSTSPS